MCGGVMIIMIIIIMKLMKNQNLIIIKGLIIILSAQYVIKAQIKARLNNITKQKNAKY